MHKVVGREPQFPNLKQSNTHLNKDQTTHSWNTWDDKFDKPLTINSIEIVAIEFGIVCICTVKIWTNDFVTCFNNYPQNIHYTKIKGNLLFMLSNVIRYIWLYWLNQQRSRLFVLLNKSETYISNPKWNSYNWIFQSWVQIILNLFW